MKMTNTFLTLFLVEAILCTVLGEKLYKKAGDNLVLTPDMSNITDPIKGILWKQGPDKVVDWDTEIGLDIYGIFQGRTTLDNATGELSIKDLSKKDSGVYSVELNSKLLEKKYTLSVIKTVPKPRITYSCNPDKTVCTLTCAGDTTDAEPVTYSWRKGEVELEASGKQLTVNETDDSEATYTCQLKNHVSEAMADYVGDLFINDPGGWWKNTRFLGFSVFVLAVLLVVVLTIIHRFKTGVWFYQKESMPWEGDFWKNKSEAGPPADASNGVSYSVVNDHSPNEGTENPEKHT